MKHCSKCGENINDNNKFCTSCGTKIDAPKKKGMDIQSVILILGVTLVIFASFVLGIISWQNMGDYLKISFFGFECLLFFALSFIIKKVYGNNFYRVFFVIGLILIPYTLSLFAYYSLLPDFFRTETGIYFYLASIYLITALLYLIINYKFKSTFVDVLALIALFISIIFGCAIFDTLGNVMVLASMIYILLIYILSRTSLFNDKFNKVLSGFSKILSLILIPFIFQSLYYVELTNMYIGVAILSLYIIYGYLVLIKEENSFLNAILPFTFSSFTFIYLARVLEDYNDTPIYVISIISLLLYFISSLLGDKVFRILTCITTYITLTILTIICLIDANYLTLLIISIVTLVFNLSIIVINKQKYVNYFLPINIFIIVLSLLKMFLDFKMFYILLVTSFVYIIIYTILKLVKNKYSNTYLITSLVLSIITFYNMLLGYDIFNIGILIVLFIIFVLTYVFKENLAISLISYIFFNFAVLDFYSSFEHVLYYSFLTISICTLIFGLIYNKFGKDNIKPYILYSEILVFIATLFNNMNYPIYTLFINIFIFAISYISILKFFNKKWWRVANIVIGLLTLIRIINTVIDVTVIASIISIATMFIIITIMYLLDVEDKKTLTVISLIMLVPYFSLIGAIEFKMFELYIIPFIIYDLVFTEVIEFKSKDAKKILTLIPLSLICYCCVFWGDGIRSIIFDIIYSLFLIILGLVRKYNYLIILGIIFMVVSLVIRLFTILNSTAVIVLLIIVGFILITIALINEIKKKK